MEQARGGLAACVLCSQSEIYHAAHQSGWYLEYRRMGAGPHCRLAEWRSPGVDGLLLLQLRSPPPPFPACLPLPKSLQVLEGKLLLSLWPSLLSADRQDF